MLPGHPVWGPPSRQDAKDAKDDKWAKLSENYKILGVLAAWRLGGPHTGCFYRA